MKSGGLSKNTFANGKIIISNPSRCGRLFVKSKKLYIKAVMTRKLIVPNCQLVEK